MSGVASEAHLDALRSTVASLDTGVPTQARHHRRDALYRYYQALRKHLVLHHGYTALQVGPHYQRGTAQWAPTMRALDRVHAGLHGTPTTEEAQA